MLCTVIKTVLVKKEFDLKAIKLRIIRNRKFLYTENERFSAFFHHLYNYYLLTTDFLSRVSRLSFEIQTSKQEDSNLYCMSKIPSNDQVRLSLVS